MIKTKIEHGFEIYGHHLYRHALKVLLVLLCIIGALAWQIPKIKVETSTEAILPEDNPDRVDYNKFRDQFGRSEIIIVAAESDDVFSPIFFERLRALCQDLEQKVPFVKEVTSIINVRSLRGQGHQIFIQAFAEHWPENPADFEALKKRAFENPLYINNILSSDGRTSAVIIETEAFAGKDPDGQDSSSRSGDSSESMAKKREGRRYFSEIENKQVVTAVREIVASHSTDGFSLSFSGVPVIMDAFNQVVIHDTKLLLILALFTTIFFLFLMFRRVSGIVFPMIVICASLLSTVGLMSLLDVGFKATLVIIPGFIVAVGVADSVHILAIFFRRLNKGVTREEAICHALGHSGLAVVMTSLTTAAGLFSFSFAEITAIAEMGIFTGIGVISALFFTITMLPALLALVPIRAMPFKTNRTAFTDRILLFFADLSIKHPVAIIIGCIALFVIFSSFLPRLIFSHDIAYCLKDEHQAKKDLLSIDDRLGGVLTIEAVLDLKKPQALFEPKVVSHIETMIREIKGIRRDEIYVGKIFSINDVLKEINQALNHNDPAFYVIPKTRQTLAQMILLFANSGSDDLEGFVDKNFSKARISIKTPWVDSILLEDFIDEVKGIFNLTFGDAAELTLTGENTLVAKTVPAALRSMAKSYVIAFVVITIMMLLLVGDVKTGLLAMFPNLLPIVLVMGFVGLLSIPLNLNTLMIGCIALGLVVDDTMHFMYNFRRHHEKGRDACEAIRFTLLGTGRAIFITSVVLFCVFLMALAASLKTLNQFGLFTAIIIILALLADFALAPALMLIISGKRG